MFGVSDRRFRVREGVVVFRGLVVSGFYVVVVRWLGRFLLFGGLGVGLGLGFV